MNEVSWILVGLVALAATVAGVVFGRRSAGGAAARSPEKSVMLSYLESAGLPDDDKTLDDLLEIISEGQRAASLDDECKDLRRQVTELEGRLDTRSSAAQPQSGVIVAGQEPEFMAFRREAQKILNTEFPYAIDKESFAAICDLTGFESAWEREQRFTEPNDSGAVLQMLREDWFHSILRTDALVRTYCQKDKEVFSAGVRLLADSLRLIAASHAIVIYPVRLLLPTDGPKPMDEEPISDIGRIPEIRRTLSDLASAAPNAASLNLAIDCRRVRILGTGIEISAMMTPFDPRDWPSAPQ